MTELSALSELASRILIRLDLELPDDETGIKARLARMIARQHGDVRDQVAASQVARCAASAPVAAALAEIEAQPFE